MSNPNLPEKKAGKAEVVAQVDAAAALDALVLALPDLEVDDLTERTLAQTMAATDLDEIFRNPEMEGFLNLLGRPLVLVDVLGHLPSRYDGASRYLVYSVIDEESGELMTVSSGSPYVAASALRAKQLGQLPAKVRAMSLDSKEKAGQSSLWLVGRRGRPVEPARPANGTGEPQHAVNTQAKYPHETPAS